MEELSIALKLLSVVILLVGVYIAVCGKDSGMLARRITAGLGLFIVLQIASSLVVSESFENFCTRAAAFVTENKGVAETTGVASFITMWIVTILLICGNKPRGKDNK